MQSVLTDPRFFERAENWERWKSSFGQEDILVKDLEFKNLNLSTIDFSNVNFSGCLFIDCDLTRTNFISANLSHSSFVQCRFRGSKLIAANLKNTQFKKCELDDINLLTSVLEHTSFVNCDLSHLDLQSINLKGITLDGCDLRGQDLSAKDLTNASLKRSNLTNANLTKAICNGASFSTCMMNGADLAGASFRSADLQQVDFTSMDLSSINFQGALLRGCDLRNSKLNHANLCNADITNAKLYGVDTLGWDIGQIICEQAYWDLEGSIVTRYKPHEFERIYAESLVIELKYAFRLTATEMATLPILIEHLQALHWGVSLRLKSVKDIAGGALVQLEVEEVGSYPPAELEQSLKEEANRIQNAQLSMRADRSMQKELKESVAAIKEKFWPRLLELAAEHEIDQIRNFSVLFIDLKDFTQWTDATLSQKLSLFRGLLKPIMTRWNAGYPNMEGDSLRATFRNSAAALECGWMIREVLSAAGFQLRIGIDMGQVMVVHNEVTDQSDLEGQAVSMAARLESMAEPGQIFVSEKIKFHAEQEDADFIFIPRKVKLNKNIGNKLAGDLISLYQLEKSH